MDKIDIKKIEDILCKYTLPDEVRNIILSLLEVIHKQAVEIAELKEEINRLKGHPGKPKFEKTSKLLQQKHELHPKKEYKKEPEQYNVNKKRDLKVDEIREIECPSSECPRCKIILHSRGKEKIKIQELEIKRKVIEFQLSKKQCKKCGYFEMGQIDEEFAGSSFGPELRSWVSILHYKRRMTEPQILEFLEEVGIVISKAEINHLLLENGKKIEPVSEQILEKGLQKSQYAHLDESGWKTKGISKYLWIVCNNMFSYFRIYPKRNSEIANELISSKPCIISVTDDYSSYGEKFKASEKQLCWIHEIRHYEKLMPITKVNRQAIYDKLTELWEYYQKIQDYRKAPSKGEKERLWNRFDEIINKKTPYDELNKRLQLTAKKKERLLVCLNFPDVPPENNCAERAIRHPVVIRKISRGSRSQKGERSLTAHLSFFDTCEKLKYDVKENLQKVLQQPISTNWNFGFP